MNAHFPLTFYWDLDGWIFVLGGLCAINATLLGHFLVLRKMSMLGDAISHSVLPGIALAFILFQSRSDSTALLFASLCGVVLVLATEYIREKGRVDEGAALGISFITLFALGLILIVYAADFVDLDPACVLFGNIELAPLLSTTFFGYEYPGSLPGLLLLLLVNSIFVFSFYKELLLSSFDEVFAEMQGAHPRVFHYLFLVLVAVTAVLCFEIFGTILVLTLFVVPVSCAHLVSRKSRVILFLAILFSILFVVTGHGAAVLLPGYFGFESTNSAGMISVFSGVFFLVLFLFSPSSGVVSACMVRAWHRYTIKIDDYLAGLYRAHEGGNTESVSSPLVLLYARLLGYVTPKGGKYQLQQKGLKRAESIIRSHRLWEAYLSDEAGYMASQVHPHADGFEHYTDTEMQELLQTESKFPDQDPHGKKIP